MDDALIEARVRKVIIERLQLSPEDYRLDARIVDDFGADSLDAVELVMAIELEFEIEIGDAEAEQALTVADTLKLVKRYVGNTTTA
jgi:acyl carrier protein